MVFYAKVWMEIPISVEAETKKEALEEIEYGNFEQEDPGPDPKIKLISIKKGKG